jgi:anti-sigma factor RsiW
MNPITCDDLIALLYDFIEGEMVAEVRETFEVHITGCSHCGLYVESYRHTVRLTRALPRCGPLPMSFAAKLQTLLEQHQSGNLT